MHRGEQNAGRADNPPVEREFAHRDEVRQLLPVRHAHRGQQRERDRQIIMTTLLGQVRWRQVDGDALGRQRQTHGGKGGLHPFAAFGHGLVGQAHHGEARHSGGQLALHLHIARVEAEIGNRLN